MKKYLQVIVYVVFILSLTVNIAVSAAEEQIKSVKFSEDGKSNFRSIAFTEYDATNLNNSDLFADPSDQKLIQGNKIIKRYFATYWLYADLSIEEICGTLNKIDEKYGRRYSYLVLGKELSEIYYLEPEEGPIYMEKRKSPLPQYLIDIQNTGSTETFFGRQCKIKDIVCIGYDPYTLDKIVYLITDQGNYIRYYDRNNSEVFVLYTEEEFRPYAIEYYDYCRFCNQKGRKVSYGPVSFPEFVEQKRQGTFVAPQILKSSRTLEICLGAAGGVVLLAGVITGIVVIRRKKRKA